MPSGEFRERMITLYAASRKEKIRLAQLAEAEKVPLSKFILAKVEEALADRPKRRPARESEALKEKVARLESENRLKDAEISQLQGLVERQKRLMFLDESAEILHPDTHLIEAIKSNGPIYETRLLEVLGIDSRDMAMIRAISAQLELLERHGRIRKGVKGYRWIR
jgi:hypothetical protein